MPMDALIEHFAEVRHYVLRNAHCDGSHPLCAGRDITFAMPTVEYKSGRRVTGG